jgi:transcriptional regulator with XRE-family HTH domain
MSDRALLRRRACLTQLQLARKAGISAPRLCLWERGEIELPYEQVERIAKVLIELLSRPPDFKGVNELALALAPAIGDSQ